MEALVFQLYRRTLQIQRMVSLGEKVKISEFEDNVSLWKLYRVKLFTRFDETLKQEYTACLQVTLASLLSVLGHMQTNNIKLSKEKQNYFYAC